MEKGKCIYAILDFNQNLNLGLKGLNGSFIYTLTYKDISAAMSDIAQTDLVVNKVNAFGYEMIIENIMSNYTLLPMRFGTMVKDNGEVIKVLEKYYDGLVTNLKRVRGKLEYGLKVLWDVAEAKLQINSSYEEDFMEFNRLKESSLHKKYLFEKLKEYKFKEALRKKAGDIIFDIHHQLKDYTCEVKFDSLVTEKLLLSGSYLVPKEKTKELLIKFIEIRQRFPRLSFLLTGPWPPYNFIDVKIKI